MRTLIFILLLMSVAYSQTPPIEPGVSHELAKWRAAHYSDVRYKLNLTLEKMSPVLKGTIEVRVKITDQSVPPALAAGAAPIILDWRKIKGHEDKSTISNVSINERVLSLREGSTQNAYDESNEHLIFRDGVVTGENVIKLDFTSPILTSGSAITRYVDKEDGAEYIYSLFVPSDASTAFPVFDQPDLKARFELQVACPRDWTVISNGEFRPQDNLLSLVKLPEKYLVRRTFRETKPISTYVFALAVGPWQQVSVPPAVAGGSLPEASADLQTEPGKTRNVKPEIKEAYKRGLDSDGVSRLMTKQEAEVFRNPPATAGGTDLATTVYVRKSQLAKFQPHAAEVFRLNREGIKFLEQYFDYKFPFPKYDLVLIPEFPFGGMEHAGATFLREDRVIFPQEPTKNDYITRANLIFHEAAHQWFGDTVTMRWFDDLWLKEGFAEFMAYKTLEKVMPEYNAWKIFYERNKQAAYLTDSTKGTTPIYQEIKNLSAAKSAYGNIVYRKAPSFLKQAEFYIGRDKFQTAVRAFLKKHEFGNAGWEDLVKEFEISRGGNLRRWANIWVKEPGLPVFRLRVEDDARVGKMAGRPVDIKLIFSQSPAKVRDYSRDEIKELTWPSKLQFLYIYADDKRRVETIEVKKGDDVIEEVWGVNVLGAESKAARASLKSPEFVLTNYEDYGYGIFLLDDKSRDYVLKNIHNEKDDFLRSMMWGSLWDSVREGELDPKDYVELVIKVLSSRPSTGQRKPPEGGTLNEDETTVATLLGRVSTAMTYYLSVLPASKNPPATAGGTDLSRRLENLLIDKMRSAPTLGQRITYYRAFLSVASTETARATLKDLLNLKFQISDLKLKTKDRFDIVTRLLILNDPEASKLLADLEKTETSDEAKRYAYAAKAGIPTKENKAKYWNDFTANKEISESWIEAAFGPFNSVRHADLTMPYLERALKELPNHKRNRKIFFVNGWLGAFIGGQRREEALAIVNKFLADNPNLDRDLRLKILENVDVIERAVKIRSKYL